MSLHQTRPELSAPLTAEDEVALAKRIETGVLAQDRLDSGEKFDDVLEQELTRLVDDGEDAKERFITSNLGLVRHFARGFMGRGLAWEDVVQEGTLGLIHAVEMFDYTRGVKFSTYASHWIKQAMGRAAAAQGRTIRLPVRVADELRRRSARDGASAGEETTRGEEAARFTGRSAARTNAVVQETLPILSLDAAWRHQAAQVTDVDPEAEPADVLTLGDVIFEDLSPEPATSRALRAALEAALEALPDRDRDILLLRAGVAEIDGRYIASAPLTLQQVADRYGLTRERIRQIESRAKTIVASRLAKVDVAGSRS